MAATLDPTTEYRATMATADEDLGALSALSDPTRRALYDLVRAHGGPVSRDDAAVALGLDRSTVAYHLDRLADDGLLAVSFARPPGRGGPGAGRPAKHYALADAEFSISVPPRDYRLVAELLARAVEDDASDAVIASLHAAAEATGRDWAAHATADTDDDLEHRLAGQGFQPFRDGAVIRLRNCPFHRLAREHTDLVCGMNLALLTGLVDGLDTTATARLDPAPDRCCVVFDVP